MPSEYVDCFGDAIKSDGIRQRPGKCSGGGRAGCGAAPRGVKDAFGAAARSASGSWTPGPLRPLPPGTAVRPVACPPQRPPTPGQPRPPNPAPNLAAERVAQPSRITRTQQPPPMVGRRRERLGRVGVGQGPPR